MKRFDQLAVFALLLLHWEMLERQENPGTAAALTELLAAWWPCRLLPLLSDCSSLPDFPAPAPAPTCLEKNGSRCEETCLLR